MKKILAVAVVMLMAASAQAAVSTIIVNFCSDNADSQVAGVYNFNVPAQTWVGTAPAGVTDMHITPGGWSNSGFLVASAPENWFNGSWATYKNTYGYAGQYSFNNMNCEVTGIPVAWGTVTMDVNWGAYGPTGQTWKGKTYTNGAGTTISTGDIENGGSFGAVSFTGNLVPEPATMSLLVIGGIATLIRRRNRRA